jgi:hypothetical protein
MTGFELEVFATELNGGATISDTLLLQYLNLAKAIVEQMRPWMILRKTDTSKTVTAGNTWQTAFDLSTITDFSRFYETETSAPIKLFRRCHLRHTKWKRHCCRAVSQLWYCHCCL